MHRVLFLRPELLGAGLPVFGILGALAAQVLGRLGGLQVRGLGPGLPDHPLQNLGILQHGAGPQVVAVEGLAFAVLQEEGLLQTLQKALLPDVGAGVVDEDAGLHVARGVDVAVDAAAGHAAAGDEQGGAAQAF